MNRFALATGWPLLADPLSGLRGSDGSVSTYDALLRVDEFVATHRPDVVLRLGAPPTSAAAGRLLAEVPEQWLIDPDERWLDPTHATTDRLVVDPGSFLDEVLALLPDRAASSAWVDDWGAADRQARATIDEHLAESEDPFEGRIARDVVATLPELSTLVVGSSMPVRDLDTFAQPSSGQRIIANRGVNGIDGFASTTLGVAAASTPPVAGLTGDLSFLHDAGGLLDAASRGLNATFVVVDNDGGGIFSFLPYASRVTPRVFERVLATPPSADLADIGRAYGLAVDEVEKASALAPAFEHALLTGGVRVVRVRTDRAANVDRHTAIFDAVARSLTGR
jgi:2-succinyl-5-enolpyruvyl-6-hydroxy-3-cyclohexene-1-carboxylate synthase